MKRSLKILIIFVAVSSLLLPLFNDTVYAVCDPATTTGVSTFQGGIEYCTPKNITPGGPQLVQASPTARAAGTAPPDIFDLFKPVTLVLNAVGFILLRFASLILALVGLLFDVVLNYTIVNMADQINNARGLGGGINEAWRTLRDIANMAFIFILIWAAMTTILDLNTSTFGKTVRNIIIIALLINFSLFFSKVVIDASNIATIGFYNSILDGAQTASVTFPAPLGAVKGFSAIFMKAVGVQTFWGTSFLGTGLTQAAIQDVSQFTTGVLGMITMLIMSMILLVMTVMFLARYIMLIFLMILSPLAFIGYIIPAFSGKFKEWWGHLVNQSFFAPYFMLLTWVAIKLIVALGPNIQSNNQFAQVATSLKDTLALFINFGLVIGFMIGALILSKKMATSTAGFAALTTGIGVVAVGGAAFAGRQTIGRGGKLLAESATIQKEAAKERDSVRAGFRAGGIRGAGAALWDKTKGAAARTTLYTSKEARDATFDARRAAIPTNALGAAIEGTLGRTALGKKLGLNNVNIPSVAVGSRVVGDTLGKPGEKGFKELQAEKDKKFNEREAAAASERKIVEAKDDVKKGANADPSTPAGRDAIDKMEKALSKLSDKETETLVASNRQLLDSQNFANKISVKQLEALNKSEQLSEADKTLLKGSRFKTINDAMVPGGPGPGTITKEIKALSDSEIEMIDPEHIKNPDFIAQMRPAQVEFAITKSSKFTTSQKEKFKEVRRKPLNDALAMPIGTPVEVAAAITAARKALKGLGHKEVASLDLPVLQNRIMIEAYTGELLKRMALEMNPADVPTLRATILSVAPGSDAAAWLVTDAGKNNFS